MVVCTPTKKARIWHMRKADGKTFSDVGNTLGISASAAPRNFGEIEC
jgi:hypothetical protein